MSPAEDGLVTIKPVVQNLLRRSGMYHRLKASFVYEVYWGIFDPRWVRSASAELQFYKRTLQGFGPRDLIFDVGANQGSKTKTFLKLGARVIAIEPDITNQKILRESFHVMRVRPQPVTLVPQALAETTGVETFWIDEPGSAKNTLNRKWVDILRHDAVRFGQTSTFGANTAVETTTLDALIAQYGRPFFVKIDVEGAEPRVLRGLTQAVPYVSFEVNLPDFLAEGLECVSILDALSPEGRFNYVVKYENGLELPEWLSHREFTETLKTCRAASVEVFWKSPLPAVNSSHSRR